MSLFIAIVMIAVLSVSSRAALLTNVQDSISSHNAGATAVSHIIKFNPSSSIVGPGDLKITFASEFNLTNVAASADVAVSGGGVTWDLVQNSDLDNVANILTLGFSSGTLINGNIVTVEVLFTKNPASAGNYDITIDVGADTRTIPVNITDSNISVSAQVPYPETNPAVSEINPEETIIVNSGTAQVISFKITDVNNDDVDYTINPSTGSTSVAPTPASPITSTQNGVTITFTYFADGLTGAQTITITADDNEATDPALVIYDIDLFII